MADVARLAVDVGRRLELTAGDLDELRLAAELHDVGKLAIPDAVLQKAGPLDEGEWRFVRQHTLVGQRILSGVAALIGVARIVRSTHENWDGTGYPDGLAGEQIPVAARIILACDAYSTITSAQPYGPARSEEEALAELRRCAGTQFEPAVVDALADVLATRTVPAAISA
jgi:HD-GYP domain-containing protein (c-di-GMP phosphodiesterase class II)